MLVYMPKIVPGILLLLGLIIGLFMPTYGQVVDENPEQLKNIDVVEHLGESIPLNLEFVRDNGDTVNLESYFHQGKPVVLVLGYYTCPMLCNLVMNGLASSINELVWKPGNEYQIVSASIDTTETDLVAGAKKANYLKEIKFKNIENGWDFLTTSSNNTALLAEAVGFKYFYDEDQKQYAHPAVLVVLTESGVISRYLYGIEYKERDFRLALLEASEGKIGSTVDRLILYCFHYDPNAGSYVVFAGNVMRAGGVLTVVIFGSALAVLWWHERRKRKVSGPYFIISKSKVN